MKATIEPIILGQAPGLRKLNDCGCCEGISIQTPVAPANRPGLTSIVYRAGIHPQFKQSLLAGLSNRAFPALQQLKIREDNDFSIALLDAWATVADVLTFYQERIANESYLRTATERRSILELGRLIGYELRPGVAANAYLAFTLEDAPGSPARTTIDSGAKVQSVPGPGEKAETFESIEPIEARADWNALQPQLSAPQQFGTGLKQLYLEGTKTQLAPGDAILIVGDERDNHPPDKDRWDFRSVQTVTPDPIKNLTLVTWAEGLGTNSSKPAANNPKCFALRQRAALFGHNALDPRILSTTTATNLHQLLTGNGMQWKNFHIQNNQIDLDGAYPKITSEGWAVLVHTKPPASRPNLLGFAQLYKASSVTYPSRSDFALSGRITRIAPDDTVPVDRFPLRRTLVFAQSEELELGRLPLSQPVYGNQIALDWIVEGLARKQTLAVTGKLARVQVAARGQNPSLSADDGTTIATLVPGDSLQMASAPLLVPSDGSAPKALTPHDLAHQLANSSTVTIKWRLIDRDGRVGSVTAAPDQILLQPAAKNDPVFSEIAFIADSDNAIKGDRDRTTLVLSAPLQNSYDRGTLAINANVARATHGETVQEILGSGEASRPYQRFTLQQRPLTYVRGTTPSGADTTLKLWVNDVLWHEVPALYGQGPDDRVFVTRLDNEGKTTIEFGDGATGARLPTGRENVQAVYRKGIGLEGLVKAGRLSQLVTRPLGLKAVINSLDAADAADPESLDNARRNAPLTVLTLDRVVSLDDYEDFARSHGAIVKAMATWTWNGQVRTVLLTVAGANGNPVSDDGLADLVQALHRWGDPFAEVRAGSYRLAPFKIAGRVIVNPDFKPEKVLAAVNDSLRSEFSFDARAFCQPVVLSEVISVMQAVTGVVAVDLKYFYRSSDAAALEDRLLAALPLLDPSGDLQAAELLTIDEASFADVKVMP